MLLRSVHELRGRTSPLGTAPGLATLDDVAHGLVVGGGEMMGVMGTWMGSAPAKAPFQYTRETCQISLPGSTLTVQFRSPHVLRPWTIAMLDPRLVSATSTATTALPYGRASSRSSTSSSNNKYSNNNNNNRRRSLRVVASHGTRWPRPSPSMSLRWTSLRRHCGSISTTRPNSLSTQKPSSPSGSTPPSA